MQDEIALSVIRLMLGEFYCKKSYSLSLEKTVRINSYEISRRQRWSLLEAFPVEVDHRDNDNQSADHSQHEEGDGELGTMGVLNDEQSPVHFF